MRLNLHAFADELTKIAIEKVAKVLPYQQQTQWSCSAACLHAVLRHYGFHIPEGALISLIGARPKRGAETTEIVEAAKRLGFNAYEKSFTYEEASEIINGGAPMIADIQSFLKPGSGHYVVITELRPEGAWLMDPNASKLDNQRLISKAEMEARWWDRALEAPHEVMVRWGVVVTPKESRCCAPAATTPSGRFEIEKTFCCAPSRT